MGEIEIKDGEVKIDSIINVLNIKLADTVTVVVDQFSPAYLVASKAQNLIDDLHKRVASANQGQEVRPMEV